MTKIQDRKYDLEERTTCFAENVILLCKKVPKTPITLPVINQLIRSGSSIGANYCEANGASSKKDFKNKIFICKKEAKETSYWLRLLKTSIDDLIDGILPLQKESHELTLIFSKIASVTA